VSTAGWIFLVGMRVIDLGAMIAWLVWFFRRREEPDDWDGWDEPGGGDGDPPPPPRDPGMPDLPLRDAGPWPVRLRDHGDRRPAAAPVRRGAPERERVRTRRAPDAGAPGGAVAPPPQQAPGFSAQKLS